MTVSEFLAVKTDYISSLAVALSTPASRITIVSIGIQTFGRRLLTQTTLVETHVIANAQESSELFKIISTQLIDTYSSPVVGIYSISNVVTTTPDTTNKTISLSSTDLFGVLQDTFSVFEDTFSDIQLIIVGTVFCIVCIMIVCCIVVYCKPL